MGGYVRIQDAKRIPITAFLSRLGCTPSHEKQGDVWYLSPFRSETEPSMHVNPAKNIWYDFGLGKGGTIIDFVMAYADAATVSDALRYLDDLWGKPSQMTTTSVSATASPAPQTVVADKSLEQHSKLETASLRPLHHYALKDYLRKRGIDPALAHPYLHELHYRVSPNQPKPYFALAFANRSANDIEGYELRSRYFQGVHGTKDISLLMPSASVNKDMQQVRVFEGFMDFLSYLTLQQTDRLDCPVIVLNGVTMAERAAEAIRELGVQQLQCYLDHDEAGKAVLAELQQHLPQCMVQDGSGFYNGYKDVNAYLMAQQQERRSQFA
ncbi:MAG: toprim domain-containing protein [Chloroflexota bacterium]